MKSDIPIIVEYAGNERVSEKTLNIPHPYAEKDALFWIKSAEQGLVEKRQYTFGIRIRAVDQFIGGIGLKVNRRFNRASLGYWIGEPFWNKGFATEGVEAILKFGFQDLALNKIYATHLLENPASGKVLLKNKMIKEGELKDHTKKGNFYRSLVQFRLTQQEYRSVLDEKLKW